MQFKTILGAASACAIALAATPAAAVNVITPGDDGVALEAPVGGTGSFEVIFGDPFSGLETIFASIDRTTDSAGGFVDQFVFQIGPVTGDPIGVGAGSVSTVGIFGSAIQFDSIVFNNGVDDFVIAVTTTAQGSGGLTTFPIPIFSGNINTLTLTGTTSGQGLYSGELTFAPVPEPGTWALMLLGFAGIGLAMRRRRKEEVRVKYAF